MTVPAAASLDPVPTAPTVTPAILLGWIAGSAEAMWFPSECAIQQGISRDSLDEPLAALRLAGLVRVTDWVKGRGQGYTSTPEGSRLVGYPDELSRVLKQPQSHSTPDLSLSPTTYDRGEEVRESLLNPNPPVLSQAIIVACVVWFAVGLFLAVREGRSGNAYLANGDTRLLQRLGGVTGVDLLQGSWWRLFSCCFVHIGLVHLLLNMYALGSIGSISEGIWGRRRFIVLYLASGFGGSCLAMALKPETLIAGASGAFWGLMTSLGAWLWINRVHLPATLVKNSLERLGVLLVINVLVSFLPGVSWAGHFGGGITGVVVASIFAFGWRWGPRGRWCAVAITVVLMFGCWLWLRWYMAHGERWIPLRLLQALSQQVAAQKGQSPDELQKLLIAVDLPQVERLVKDVQLAHVSQILRKNLREDIQQLKANSLAIRPESPLFDATLQRAIRQYTAQVAQFADRMLSVLDNPNEKTDEFQKEWASLRQLAATIPINSR